MSAGTPVHSQWKRNMYGTAVRSTAVRKVKVNVMVIRMIYIKRAEFPVARLLFIRDKGIPLSRNRNYMKIRMHARQN